MPKRKKTLTSSPASPPFRPVMDPTLNMVMDKLHAMSCQMNDMLSKQDKLEEATKDLKSKLDEVTQLNKEMSATISLQGDRINFCEQALRASSIRIVGLPVTRNSTPQEISTAVYSTIIQPVFELAKAQGEIDSYPTLRFCIESAFCIPSKNPNSCPVIAKLASPTIKNLVFQLKKEALPPADTSTSGRPRPKYGVYEDLTPANFAQFRAISEDPRTTAVWTYNGQTKFRVKDRDVIYKVKALSDTVDSLTKTSRPTN